MRTHDGKEYPDKIFYRIQEVSDITGEKAYVLRYWESEFSQLKPEKDDHDQRRYRSGDIDVILEIKRLLHEERYTIAGAKKKLETRGRKGKTAKSAADTPPKGSRVDTKQLKKLRREIRALRSDLLSLISFMDKK